MCCAILNTKLVLVELLLNLTKKHPSASKNPYIKLEFLVKKKGVGGLIAGNMLGKAAFNRSYKPFLKTHFRDNTFFNPLIVKCYLLLINIKVCLNI